MKKIGLWMAALTAVTVGGVYATFNYADSNDMNRSMSDTAIGVANGVQDGAAGELDVNAKGLIIMVDSAATILGNNLGTTNAHKAMIQTSGEIVVTFTPKAGLQETDILDNGIHTKVYFKASWGDVAAWKYDSNDDSTADMQVLASLNTTAIEIHQVDETEQTHRWTKDNNTGTFTFTITADQLFGTNGEDPILGSALLVLNDIVLETYDEYNAFEDSFSAKNLEAHVEAVSEDD